MKCQETGDRCVYGLNQPEAEMCGWCKTIREIREGKRTKRKEYRL